MLVFGLSRDPYLCQESALLQPASPFYKTFAIECSRAQVSVDMFLFSTAYQDVATLGMCLSHAFLPHINGSPYSLLASLHRWSDVLLPRV